MPHPRFVDVSATAAEVGHGFSILQAPVLVTWQLWDTCVQWDERDTDAQEFQEQDARLWNVLFVCGTTIGMNLQRFLNTMGHKFSILVIPRDGSSTAAVKANLVASGNSEAGSLVIELVELVREEALE